MKQLSLNMKIGLVVGMLVIGNAVFAILAFDKMNAMNQSLAAITGVAVPRMSQGFALHDVMRRIAIAERGLMAEDSKDGAARVVHEMSDLSTQFEKSLEATYAEATVKGRERLLHAKEVYKTWRAVEQEVQNDVLEGHTAAAMQLANEKSRKLMQDLQSDLNQFVDVNKNVMDEETERVDLEYARARGTLTTGIVAILLIGTALAFLILASLARSIGGVIEQLNASSSKTTLAAQQIAMSSSDLSSSVTKQARDLDKTARQVREMNNAVKKNAAAATKACELSLYSESAAKKGKSVVETMITAISEINDANTNIAKEINESNERIVEIVKVINEIGEKTRVINEIVFQTKLLSFNASAEATRAGEHGRGFAIVADEIRTLAHSSGVAARDITLLLDGSVAKVDEIVKTTRTRVEELVVQCNSKVDAGTRVAAQCNHVLEEIVDHVGAVNKMAFDISNASDEQAQGISEVFKTVKRIEETTNENAMVAVEASKISDELTGESKGLRQIVSVLMRTIRGGKGIARSGPGSGSSRDSGSSAQSHSSSRASYNQEASHQPAGGPQHDLDDKVIVLNPNRERGAERPAAEAAPPEAVAAEEGAGGESPAVEAAAVHIPLPTEPVTSDSNEPKVAAG